MAAEAALMSRAAIHYSSKWKKKAETRKAGANKLRFYSAIRASHSVDDKSDVYKQLGLFSLKKKIEDAVIRAEMLAPEALEIEEERRIQQEEIIRECSLWDDPVKSNEILVNLADSAKVVDALKDLKYKAEEAKLISQLADVEGINYPLFEEAYSASLDVSKFLDRYQMLKLLKGPYDMEGACITIQAESEDINSEIWAQELVRIYMKWAKRLGYRGRIVETHPSINSALRSATIEFEFECAYGYLLGERGTHQMVNSQNGSRFHEVSTACVDVVPLFLRTVPDLEINDEELIASTTLNKKDKTLPEQAVCLQHIPTGIIIQSSGERNLFANKMKALNRLKGKLLVIAWEQNVSNISSIKGDAIVDAWKAETRRYVSQPYKLVEDVKTGLQLPDLNSVLDGNIEPLISAHINSRISD